MKPHCHGASLIESLTALSVFAVGSAASGAWFHASMETDAAASRTMAALAAVADLRERMHANTPGVSGGYYNAAAPMIVGCVAGCAPAQLAADDLTRFRRRLDREVGPSASSYVRCEDATRCAVRVALGRRVVVAVTFRP
jgi:Tfp pilus assembly protein PilV